MDTEATSTNSGRRIQLIGLWVLLFAAALGLPFAYNPEGSSRSLDTMRYSHYFVDQRPLQTAHDIMRLASSPDERLFAQSAVQLANDEVELALAGALRAAVKYPPPPTPEIKQLMARQEQVSTLIAGDQEQVYRLGKQIEHAATEKKTALQDQLELAQAQLELDQDELDDLKRDLARSGGDAVAAVKAQLDRHNFAREHGADTLPPDTPGDTAEAGYNAGNLVSQIGAYYALSRKITPLELARSSTMSSIAVLNQIGEQVRMRARGLAQPVAAVKQRDSKEQTASAAALASVREQYETRHTLDDLEKRRQDEQELASLYGDWIVLLRSRQREALYGMLRSMLWILLIIPASYFVGKAAERFLIRLSRKRPHLAKFQPLVRFAWQAAEVLLILMVILGVPEQLPAAIFGLVGASLTVALKDLAGVFVESRLRGLVPPTKEADAGGS